MLMIIFMHFDFLPNVYLLSSVHYYCRYIALITCFNCPVSAWLLVRHVSTSGLRSGRILTKKMLAKCVYLSFASASIVWSCGSGRPAAAAASWPVPCRPRNRWNRPPRARAKSDGAADGAAAVGASVAAGSAGSWATASACCSRGAESCRGPSSFRAVRRRGCHWSAWTAQPCPASFGCWTGRSWWPPPARTAWGGFRWVKKWNDIKLRHFNCIFEAI